MCVGLGGLSGWLIRGSSDTSHQQFLEPSGQGSQSQEAREHSIGAMPGGGDAGSGGLRYFAGEEEDPKQYRRWKLWLTNKLLTMGDKLPKEAYGSFVVTLLQGKALETIEHLQPGEYQKTGGEKVLLELLDRRFPDKEMSKQRLLERFSL